MKEGEEIDKLFKKRMEDPANNLAYNEDDWDALEQMLDKGKKRPFIVYWLPIVSGIAAMMLLFAGWWFFYSAQTNVKPGGQVVVKTKPAATVIDTNSKTNPSAPVVAPAGPANNLAENNAAVDSKELDGTPINIKPVTTGKKVVRQNAGTVILAASGLNTPQGGNANGAVIGNNNVPAVITNGVPVQKDTVPPANANRVAMQKDTTPRANVNGVNDAPQGVIAQTPPAKAPVKVKTKVATFGANRPQFAISVIASSDVNGVNSFQQSKVGSNFGAMFSVSIKKWTVTTGAAYSIKPYKTSFANYTTAYQFKTDPTEVMADCRMLDIPLNVAYQVYQKHRNKFSLGTGLSSYLMLHENYKYTYSPATSGPAGYLVANPKNYLLSVVNLNATFEHQVNSKFSLSVQPYMKLPLSAVGYSQVNLHTAGVAVGFNWNINSFTKPK